MENVIIVTGRMVTKQTAWWYYNSSFENRDRLFCIHNKNLLQGCNKCREEIDT